MLKQECHDWEFPFLWAWNIEDTTNHLNKPDFTKFKGRNLGLTKKELIWATFVRLSFTGLWVNNASTTTKWETYQYLLQLNKLHTWAGESLNSQKSDFSSFSKFQTVLWLPSFRAPWIICWVQLPICGVLVLSSASSLLAATTYHCPNDSWNQSSNLKDSLHLDASEIESRNKVLQLEPNRYSKLECPYPLAHLKFWVHAFVKAWNVKNKFLFKFGYNPVQLCVSAFGFTQSKCLCNIAIWEHSSG